MKKKRSVNPSSRKEEDQLFLSGLQAKEPEIIQKLYARLYKNFNEKFLFENGQKRLEKRDLIHRTILIALKKVIDPTFVLYSTLDGFLYGIMRNVSRQEMKKLDQIVTKEYPVGELDELDRLRNSLDKEMGLSNLFENREIKALVKASISKLNDRCKKVLTGVFYFEKSHKEIALELNTTADVVKTTKYRCLETLKGMLKTNPLITQ